MAGPSTAAAQTRTITCESQDDRRRDCYVANLDQGSVSVEKQLSKSSCNRGSDWGTSNNNIWVSSGCRARFAYRTRSGTSSSGGSKYGTITCESRGDNRHECHVADLDESSVTMDDRLSDAECVRGRSWGTSRNTIWVRDGCRAKFGYVRRSGGNGGGSSNGGYNNGGYGGGGYGSGNASRSEMRQACIERAAREWAVTESNLEVSGPNRLDDGSYEYVVSSKRTRGSCYVNANGNVRRLSTY
ncbi:MAG: DUF3011 domain-containing protein [Gemmatimonadales bacterium]|nr:DUF3011 domain-containing protein [Gemmatimonadales bacterium]